MGKQSAKKYSTYFMIVTSIIMLVIPALPHHHHKNSDAIHLCLHEFKGVDCNHSENHTENTQDGYHIFCVSHFNFTQKTAEKQVSITPFHFIEADLLTCYLLFSIPKTDLNKNRQEYHYLESLHDFLYIGSVGLRAPPSEINLA